MVVDVSFFAFASAEELVVVALDLSKSLNFNLANCNRCLFRYLILSSRLDLILIAILVLHFFIM